MDAERLQLLAPGIGDCSLAAVGEHDRSAVSGMQREQLLTRRHLRHVGLRKQGLNVLGSDRLDVSDAAVAELGQRLRRHLALVFSTVHIVHGARLLSYSVETFTSLIALFDRYRSNNALGLQAYQVNR